MDRARLVRIGRLERAVEAIADRPVPAWDGRRHFSGEPARTLRYLLVLDTINFSFWSDGASAGGYYQLAERLRDVYRTSDELAEAKRLASISGARLGQLLGDFPMLAERAVALRELGGAGFERLVADTAAGTAAALAQHLASYRDVASYDGRVIPLYKRAQIVPADLSGAGLKSFPDLADLTCFPDYKLPQVLRHLGALEYSDELAGRVDGWRQLVAGEPAEVEIRSATVVAVERLRDELETRGRALKSIEVDWLLWHLAQETYPMRPYHRVRTVFY